MDLFIIPIWENRSVISCPSVSCCGKGWVYGARARHHTRFSAVYRGGRPARFEIYQVKQDSKGYIWFATGNGVSRFDEYEFKNFSLKDGLPDNTVFEIFEDARGRIWFLPLSCRLSYYQDGKIYPYPYNYIFAAFFVNPIKCSFYVDEKRFGIHRYSQQGHFLRLPRGSRLITQLRAKPIQGCTASWSRRPRIWCSTATEPLGSNLGLNPVSRIGHAGFRCP